MILVWKYHEAMKGQQIDSVGGRDHCTLTCLVPALSRSHYKKIQCDWELSGKFIYIVKNTGWILFHNINMKLICYELHIAYFYT